MNLTRPYCIITDQSLTHPSSQLQDVIISPILQKNVIATIIFEELEDEAHSVERYFDTITRRIIAVGRHDDRLVMVPYEEKKDTITPITIHVTTRQQINFRPKTGRFVT